RELLGVYISEHPVEEALRKTGTGGRVQIVELASHENHDRVRLIARVNSLKRLVTRHGKSMASADIEDLTGSIELVMFPDQYEQLGDLLEVDAILDVFARYQVDGD